MPQKIKTLIIPAAGAGTRLRPATYATPKEMLRLVDRPIIWYLLKEASLAGIEHTVVVTNSDNPQTRNFFESERSKSLMEELPNMRISFVEVATRGGDGEAILAAQPHVSDEPFAVTMGDLVTLPGESILGELVEQYQRLGTSLFSVENVPRERTNLYGVISPLSSEGPVHVVGGIVEKPLPEKAPSTLAMTGKYVLAPSIFGDLREITRKAAGEVKLAHALDLYARREKLFAIETVTNHFDTGTKQSLFEAEIAFSLAHTEIGESARQFLSKLK